MNNPNPANRDVNSSSLRLKRLSPAQVQRIDDFLDSVGDYGEVHLIIQSGELRYINTVESHKAWLNGEKRVEKGRTIS